MLHSGFDISPGAIPRTDELATERKIGQTDSIIEEYADHTGLTRLAFAPQQMQHVGLRSSRENLEINTQSTWAFWFEENDAEKLKIEHERLIAASDKIWLPNSNI
jgi:hypothetical protein